MKSSITVGTTGRSPIEPTSTCASCGRVGTVARAIRLLADGQHGDAHVFCATCWPTQRAELEARWQQENRVAEENWMEFPSSDGPATRGMLFEAATWHNTVTIVEEILAYLDHGTSPPLRADDLTRVASEINTHASKMIGPMPPIVARFVERFVQSAS